MKCAMCGKQISRALKDRSITLIDAEEILVGAGLKAKECPTNIIFSSPNLFKTLQEP